MTDKPVLVDKSKYRALYLRKRKTLSTRTFDEKNTRLLFHFCKFFKGITAEVVHSYLPIESNKEVNTWSIIELFRSVGTKIVVSKSGNTSNELTHYFFEDYKQLKKSKWGIPEPQYGEKVGVESIDLVLIPLIVFDRKGHRIGYGEGYYDLFLSECRDDCLKVGLSLTPPLDYIPTTEPHDIPLDYCITSLGTYTFKK